MIERHEVVNKAAAIALIFQSIEHTYAFRIHRRKVGPPTSEPHIRFPPASLQRAAEPAPMPTPNLLGAYHNALRRRANAGSPRLVQLSRFITLTFAGRAFRREGILKLGVLACALLVATASLRAASGDSGVLTGTVSNTVTNNLLEGARVSITTLGLSALTDNTGRFVLAEVPMGSHEVVVTCLGLDPSRTQVTMAAGTRVVRDFSLSTGICALGAFKVTGEREGDALVTTAQRNADNVKNVVATDSFGNLPNMSASEVVARLPGTTGGCCFGMGGRPSSPAATLRHFF